MIYVVLDENTLGYLSERTPNLMGVLHGSGIVGGHNAINGPVSVDLIRDDLRIATWADFEAFRVHPHGHMKDLEGLSDDEVRRWKSLIGQFGVRRPRFIDELEALMQRIEYSRRRVVYGCTLNAAEHRESRQGHDKHSA